MVAKRGQSFAIHSGFTLLELLLATSVLASMSVFMGTMLIHARSWREGGDRLHVALALPRATDLLQRQWSERRVLTDNGAAFDAENNQLRFISSAPLLDPQWPLVLVIYQIERAMSVGQDGLARWNLVYEEQPITDVTSGASQRRPVGARGYGNDQNRLVLLESCTVLRLEWFGREGVVEDGDESVSHWIAINNEDESLTSASALRLIGNYQGEAFSCVLATEASRSSSF